MPTWRNTPSGGKRIAISIRTTSIFEFTSRADPSGGLPAVIWKDGGLPGFGAFVRLLPARHLAVAVMVNAGSYLDDTGRSDNLAGTLANNIMTALYYD